MVAVRTKSSPSPVLTSDVPVTDEAATDTSSSGSPATATVKSRATTALVRPAPLVARTWKRCAPTGRSAKGWADEHATKAEASIEHSKVTGSSSAVNEKETSSVVTVPEGPAVMVTVGAVLSTAQVRVVDPVLPKRSVALTCRRCVPSARPVRLTGDVHGAKAPPSTLQVTVASASSTVKSRRAVRAVVTAAGPLVMTTTGGVASTKKARPSPPRLPAGSVARTEKECGPSSSPAMLRGLVHGSHVPPSSRHSTVAVGSSTVKV